MAGGEAPEAGEVREVDEEAAASPQVKDVNLSERLAEEDLILRRPLALGHAHVVVPHEHYLRVRFQVFPKRFGLRRGAGGCASIVPDDAAE